MKYVIGVDGGGTKTEAVAYDLDGKALATSLSGFGNLVNDKEKALNNIETSISELVNKFGRDGLSGIYLGLAGCEVGNNAELVANRLKETFNIESSVMNDGELALKAILKGEDGVLVIAGTGSISFGIKDNKQVKCGGWGQLLGDEGSAYKVSIEAYKKMIKESDFGLERSAMSQEILEYLDLKEVDDLVGFIYSSTKDEIAKIGHIVSKHAELGDEEAIEILKTEGVAIAKAAERVYTSLGFESCSIGLVGSTIKKSVILRNAFEGYLNKNINISSFIYDDVSPTLGAYYIYRKENL